MNTAEHVILVHGLWYGSHSMSFLARRLRKAGYSTHLFDYSATSVDLATNARRLSDFHQKLSVSPVHFVGHSYGGLVIAQMMVDYFESTASRAVLLGSPLQGSQTVRRALKLPGSKKLFGKAARGLSEGVSGWKEHQTIAMIAGSKAIGLGRLFALGGRHGDGSIDLAETESSELHSSLVLDVTHSGMIYSGKVANQLIHFLKEGKFGLKDKAREA